MIISCIGDSLTEGDYGIFGKRCIANVKEINYPYFLRKTLGCEVRNFGKCGYRITTFLDNYEKDGVDVAGSDIILIMLGTNGGVEPNNPEAAENQAYPKLIERCKAQAPTAKIVLCTPPYATGDEKWSNCGYAEQVQNAVEFVRAFAKKEGYPLIDVAACEELTANEEIMQPNDGLHFGEVGYYVLAKCILNGLKDLSLL